MVEISLSGSGEGLGRAIARGYSTGNDINCIFAVIPAKAGIHAANPSTDAGAGGCPLAAVRRNGPHADRCGG